MKDTLQKRLQEMEGENPSPSLVTVEPALRERIGFLGRYFSKAVKQVPQKTEQERLELEFARKSKRLGELIEENKIKIAESGKWFNSREDYIEIFGGGVDKKDCNLRYAKMNINPYRIYEGITATEKGHIVVFSKKCGPIKCDTIIRQTSQTLYGENTQSYYYLDGKYTGFNREFTPSMGGGTPNDDLNDPRYKLSSLELKSLSPLIEAMEITIGRTLIERPTEENKKWNKK